MSCVTLGGGGGEPFAEGWGEDADCPEDDVGSALDDAIEEVAIGGGAGVLLRAATNGFATLSRNGHP